MYKLASPYILHLSQKWNSYSNINCCGNAFIEDELLDGYRLAQLFEKLDISDKLDTLKNANGFFSLVQVADDYLFASVDRVRSTPIFYSCTGESLLISDDPHWIVQQIGNEEPEPAAKYELLLTRFVTGPNTLHPKIMQLQAGEALIAEISPDNKVTIKSIRYFTYTHKPYLKSSKTDLFAMHDKVLQASFKRFTKWADNRPVILPLSGGYDSRLVAIMLKRLGYENIQAFSFGKPDNPEAVISRKVADNLGIKWTFIPYDNNSMYQWHNSEEWKAFTLMADGLCAACLDREWPAIWELKKQNLIPEDAIFAPGHSGDFTCGGHIPLVYHNKRHLCEEDFLDFIYKLFYTMWNWKGEKENIEPLLREKIIDAVNSDGSIRENYSASNFEKWVWQEWQTKYIINGVRVYEFWGHKWWLPLWDSEYMDFWRSVPVRRKIQKRLYKEHVSRLYSQITGISRNEAIIRNDTPSRFRSFVNLMQDQIIKSPLRPLARDLKRTLGSKHLNLHLNETPQEDWEQSLGRMSKNAYLQLAPYITCRSSCITLEKLGYIDYADQEVSDEVISMLKSLKG